MISGTLAYVREGMRAAVQWGAELVESFFDWLGGGLERALAWLRNAALAGLGWVDRFLENPSLEMLRDGLFASLAYVHAGVQGLRQWGWQGLVGAVAWAREGVAGLGRWLYDGLLRGLPEAGAQLLYILELIGVGEGLQLIYGLVRNMRRLNGAERSASMLVHAPGQIPYDAVFVDENSLLLRAGEWLARTFGSGVIPAAVTTMHVLHLPAGGSDLPTIVHELTHVAQYEAVGAIYMAQALHAQHLGAGYDYTTGENLTAARARGKRFADFNREQQAAMAEDYYKLRVSIPVANGETLASLQPFIDDMRSGAL
jgi:hypothetical protein